MAELYKGVTEETYATWLTASQADELITSAFGDAFAARFTFIERLKGGQVRAVSRKSQWGNRRDDVPLFEILSSAWSESRISPNVAFWISSDLVYDVMQNYTSVRIAHYGVRFDPKGVQDIIGNVQPAPQPSRPVTRLKDIQADTPKIEIEPPVVATNMGGRPPKDWWPDLWVEICRQMYTGDFSFDPNKTRQAEIEKIMLDWATSQEHKVSEATIRKAANKLYKVLKSEG